MPRLLFLLLALVPVLALSQSETCPRIWRSSDTLLTDPASQIQWYRDGAPIPGATQRWYVPTQPGRYSVEATGQPSVAVPVSLERGYVLAGYVFDELHRPVEGASVRKGRFTATTDTLGYFALAIDEFKPAEQVSIVVTAEKPGYWKNASRQYISRFDTTETHLLLHTKRVTNRVDARRGGQLAYRGFTLQLPPEAVQTTSGEPYLDTILVYVEGARPTDPDFGLRMPGGTFEATDAQGNHGLLYSYGYLSIDVTTPSGEALKLRPGKRATIRFHLPYTETYRPDSVPLWHFDPDSATWVQKGWTKRNGSVYEAEVAHFEAWNCDIHANRATVRGRVLNCNNEPIAGALVRVGQRLVLTDSLGAYWSFVPGGVEFKTWAAIDTLPFIQVPALAERTLQDLKGRGFHGLAVWEPEIEVVSDSDIKIKGNLSIAGNLPEGKKISLDDGQSWQPDRYMQGLEQAPEWVRLESEACVEKLQVVVMARPEDCRELNANELDAAQKYSSWAEAFRSNSTIYKLDLGDHRFEERWDLLDYFACVAGLNLGNNGLKTLPKRIENATNLQDLSLQQNSLTTLPANIGSLTKLVALDVSANRLMLLPESIGNLANLQMLELSRNRLASLPVDIGDLINLESLGLQQNSLTSLPESIVHLRALKSLYLSVNQLTSLPERIGNLVNLERLGLDNNQLASLPESIGNLTKLQSLNLAYNQLTSLPESIGNLTNLEQLYVDSNQLTTLPESIGNLTNLRIFEFHNNPLVALPESIGNLTKLRVLQVTNGRQTDLPESIGNLTMLELLDLSNNQLTSLPDGIGNLVNLQKLNFEHNQLTRLPESIGNLTNLEGLWLGHNQLTDLPPTIANLAETLKQLDLRGNPIPVERRDTIQAMLPKVIVVFDP